MTLLIVLTFGLAASLSLARYAQQLQATSEKNLLVQQTDMLRLALLNHYNAKQQVLLGAAGLFSASDDVSRQEWHAYVQSLGIEQRFPGLQRIGYAESLTADTLSSHIQRMRAEGLTDYVVFPLDASNLPPTAVVFLEPYNEANRRAIGFNMYSDPIRRAAMDRARDTGQPALSGRVALLQNAFDPSKAYVMLYVPVYRNGKPTDTVEARRAALRGWVYSPLSIEGLIRGTFKYRTAELSIELLDQTEQNPESGETRPIVLFGKEGQAAEENRGLEKKSLSLLIAGRQWMVRVRLDSPAQTGNLSAPVVILISGASLTLLICALVLILGSSESRARALALEMTAALRRSEERQRAILQNTADGIMTTDEQGIVRSFNAAAEAMFGYRDYEVIGQNVSMLMPVGFQPDHDSHVTSLGPHPPNGRLGERREVLGLRRNGEAFPVWLAVSKMPAAEDQELIGMVSDISERKQAEQQLATANRLRESIVESAPLAILSTDKHGRILSYNAAAELLFGYTQAEAVGQMLVDCLFDDAQLESLARKTSQYPQDNERPGIDVIIQGVQFSRMTIDEWSCKHKDGSHLDVESSISMLTGPDGSLSGYLFMLQDISERKKTRNAIEHMAHHDALTGLPNRALLHDRLQQAMKRATRERRTLAVLMLDLDHFKRINDSLGHHAGDEMLLVVSQRLYQALRETDTVSRMGGDEFVILLPDVSGPEDVSTIIDKLLEHLNQPLRLDGHELSISASIGVCMYPDHGHSAEEILKLADTAMYQAKDSGRGHFRFFESQMLGISQQRLETEVALRKALSRKELCLNYQPQVNLADGMLIGCEALLRWNHPVLGQVSPQQFIPLAEESGLIEKIGEWVLHEACAQTRAMQIQLQHPKLLVSVNISPRQFMRGDLRKTLERVLQSSGLAASCLEIEITESMLLEYGERTLDLLRDIRSMGIQVAIDDFGIGYSNLSYIKRFPIDRLKIDQSFIRDIHQDANDAAVVSAIIVIAQTLHLGVTAEGIETPEQLNFLIDRQCEMGQGYLFGKPLPQEDFVRHAREHLHWISSESAQAIIMPTL